MNTETVSQPSTAISAAKLLSIVSALSGTTRPPDDEAPPRPPGPFDPILRTAVKDWWMTILALSDPRLYELPELGGPIRRDRLSLVGLNPQPLPPRSVLMATLAQTVVSRADVLNELASALTSDAEKRGIIIVSGYVGRFVNEVRNPNFRLPLSNHIHARLVHCHAPPNPLFREDLSGTDLVLLGAAFAEAARGSFDESLRRIYQDAAEQLAEVGAARVR